MRRDQLEALAAALAQEICAGRGLIWVDTTYRKSNGVWRVLVRIDRPEGVSIDDCAEVSKALGAKLDELDPIEHQYTLEVSSAGLSDPLKTERDFERFVGRMIEVEMPLFGGSARARGKSSQTIVGRLEEFSPTALTVRTGDGQMKIERSQIRRARPAVDFEGTGAKGR